MSRFSGLARRAIAFWVAGLLVSIPFKAQAIEEGVLTSAADVKWELGGLFLGITGIGINSWEWGSSDFHFGGEGWFGMDTGSGGMDKLGHAYSSYLISEFLQARMKKAGHSAEGSAANAALFSGLLMTYVEVFDGFSGDHGFSWEDMLMNAGGIGLSYLRGVYPSLAEKFDFRLQYWKSARSDGFRPLSDYEGQRFLFVVKPAGFDLTRDSWLKYVELSIGYDAKGFARKWGYTQDDRHTALYAGVSLNLDEVLFKPFAEMLGRAGGWLSTGLHYIQIPGTTATTSISTRP